MTRLGRPPDDGVGLGAAAFDSGVGDGVASGNGVGVADGAGVVSAVGRAASGVGTGVGSAVGVGCGEGEVSGVGDGDGPEPGVGVGVDSAAGLGDGFSCVEDSGVVELASGVGVGVGPGVGSGSAIGAELFAAFGCSALGLAETVAGVAVAIAAAGPMRSSRPSSDPLIFL